MKQIDNGDPHDECTHWIGSLPKTVIDSDKHLDKRDTGGSPEPDILSTELGMEKKQ